MATSSHLCRRRGCGGGSPGSGVIGDRWRKVSKRGIEVKRGVNRDDWALLALSKSPDAALTPVQIQKTLFLLGENYRNDVGTFY